jgi:hypothetical protein
MVFGHVCGSDIYPITDLADFMLTTDLVSGRSLTTGARCFEHGEQTQYR